MSGPHVEVLLRLVLSLCDELATCYPALSNSLAYDKKYISNRVFSEGLSFLTVTLPKFGKAFDRWLANEDITTDFSVDFLTPLFLKGVKNLIYGSSITDSERAYLYRWIRQLTFLLYKLELPYTQRQLEKSYIDFAERDLELEESTASLDPFQIGSAASYLGEVFSNFNISKLSPKHGPGSVATSEVGDDKWTFKRYYRSVHRRFPWYDYFVPTPAVWSEDTQYCLNWYRNLTRLDYPEARVVAVPKDSRGPRLISEEPLELQYIQQGYLNQIVPFIENHPKTSGFINFTRQDINQQLALQSSIDQKFATIDLSEASDRVSDQLVHFLFPSKMYTDLRALRSYYTLLPNGTRVRLNKFAPMGSAICFPIEASVFWALCKGAIHDATKGSDGLVYVYGDDIIIPTEHYQTVCDGLTYAGLKVNTDKSYHTGFFRESCGVDAWKGYIITPTRLKQLPPSQPSDISSIVNWVSTSNLLRERGYSLTADMIVEVIQSIRRLPWNLPRSPLSFIDRSLTTSQTFERNSSFKHRLNQKTHQSEFYGYQLKQISRESHLKDWRRLHRNLLMPPYEPDKWQPRNAVRLKRQWVQIH